MNNHEASARSPAPSYAANARTSSAAFLKEALKPLYHFARRIVRERFPVVYRSGTRYDTIAREIMKLRPRTIVEIGTCRGENAERMLRLGLRYGPVEYHGFDLFETMDQDTLQREAALRPDTLESVRNRLASIRVRGRAPGINLAKGDTSQTLTAEALPLSRADFIFIDGGHSYETVRSDWENARRLCHAGTVVIFDDYPNWGVQKVVDDIDTNKWVVTILGPGDYFFHTNPPLNCKLVRVTMRDSRRS